jgi:hypothetical protein
MFGTYHLPQDFFVDRFVSGLKEDIKHHVQCQKPADFLSANWYARQYEKPTYPLSSDHMWHPRVHDRLSNWRGHLWYRINATGAN